MLTDEDFVKTCSYVLGKLRRRIKDSTTVVAASLNPASRLFLIHPSSSTPANSATFSSGFSHSLITASEALSSRTRSQQPSDKTVADVSTSLALAYLSSSTVITANDFLSTTNSLEGQTSSMEGRTAGIIVHVITVAGVSGVIMMLMARRLQRKRLKRR